MKMKNISEEDHSMKHRMTTNANTKDVAERSELKLDWSSIRKKLHRTMENATTFRCQKCNSEFRQEAALKNHSKACKGGKMEGDRKECRICNNLVGRTNYARHVRSCEQRNNVQEERAAQGGRSDQTNAQTARKYISKRTMCTYCGANVTATNLARHQNSRACMASDQ